jgi:acetyltransferase-like isoleucine patch superfamily enzyme
MGFQRGRLSWDWYPGEIPENTEVSLDAYMETTYSFHLYRSCLPCGLRIGKGSSTYLGTMLDVGKKGSVEIGEYSLTHGAWIISDEKVTIGDYVFISWNVVLMDTYRYSMDRNIRRAELRRVAESGVGKFEPECETRPICIGSNVWIGFDSCVLPGVNIGEGAIVGARSVVNEDVAPYTIVAGNPARVIRTLEH